MTRNLSMKTAYEHQNNNGSFKQKSKWEVPLKDLILKVTLEDRVKAIKISIELRAATGDKARYLETRDGHLSRLFNVSFTQLTIVSSLTFCPPPISSRIFNVYLNKTKNDFWRKVIKESTIVSHRDLFSILCCCG